MEEYEILNYENVGISELDEDETYDGDHIGLIGFMRGHILDQQGEDEDFLFS